MDLTYLCRIHASMDLKYFCRIHARKDWTYCCRIHASMDFTHFCRIHASMDLAYLGQSHASMHSTYLCRAHAVWIWHVLPSPCQHGFGMMLSTLCCMDLTYFCRMDASMDFALFCRFTSLSAANKPTTAHGWLCHLDNCNSQPSPEAAEWVQN